MVLNIKIPCLWIHNIFLTYFSSPFLSWVSDKYLRLADSSVQLQHGILIFFTSFSFPLTLIYYLSMVFIHPFSFHHCAIYSDFQCISHSLPAQRAFIYANSLPWKGLWNISSVCVHSMSRIYKQKKMSVSSKDERYLFSLVLENH